MNWFQKFLFNPDENNKDPESSDRPVSQPPSAPADPSVPEAEALLQSLPISAAPEHSARKKAEEYLAKVQAKTNRLAEEFAQGLVNRAQFVSLFEHYQRERNSIEQMMEIQPEAWQNAATEGKSLLIRQTHYARPIGFSIYENATSMPITTLGRFDLDSALMVPMLSSYREAAREMFGARVRSTQIESGRWMCYVAGQYTTLIALYSTEPAARQLKNLEETHIFFEKANHPRLSASPISVEGMVFPHEYYLR